MCAVMGLLLIVAVVGCRIGASVVVVVVVVAGAGREPGGHRCPD